LRFYSVEHGWTALHVSTQNNGSHDYHENCFLQYELKINDWFLTNRVKTKFIIEEESLA
jgi:hypothetical protein